MSQHFVISRAKAVAAGAVAGCLAVFLAMPESKAATWYWDTTTTGLWSDGANWSNNATSGGTTGTVPTNDTTTDVAFFNQSTVTGTQTVQLDANQSVSGIIIANTGSTTFTSNSATARLLTLGAGGITVNSGGGHATFGDALNPLTLALATSSTFANNTSNRTLSILGGISRSAADTTSRTLTIAGSGTTSISGAISDGGAGDSLGLTKIGNGTLLLLGINTFSGTTFLDAGTVQVAAASFANAFNGGGDITFRGGTLFLTAAAAPNLGTRIKNSSSTVRLQTNSSSASVSATVDSSNVGGFTKSGLGAVTLTGNSTYSGPTTIGAGGLTLTGSLNPATTVTLGSGVQGVFFQLGNTTAAVNQEIADLTTAGSGVNTVRGGHGTNISTLTVNIASGSTSTYSGGLGGSSASGNLALTKAGAGTFVLSGTTSSYVGATTINGGILEVAVLANGGVASSIGNASTSAANLVINGGTLRYVGSGGASDRNFTTGTNGATLDASGSGALTLSGTSAFQGTNTSATLTFTGTGTADNTFSGSVGDNGTGATSIVKTGSGKWIFSGQNTFSGSTTVNTGILALGASNVLSASTAVTVGGGELSLGTNTNTVASFAITSGSLTGSGKLSAATYGLAGGAVAANIGAGTVNVTANSTLNGASDATALNLNAGILTLGSGSRFTSSSIAVTGSSGASVTLGGAETFGSLAGAASVVIGGHALTTGSANTSTIYGGVLSGAGGTLTKVGSGSFTLTNVNTYSGVTTVSQGLLAVNGSIAGAATVMAGATIGGSGGIGGALSGAGLVSPGNSPGILTASQFDPTGGLDAAFEFKGFLPAYNAPSASVNDVLRLTDAAAFLGSHLTAANVIDVYFDIASVGAGGLFEGGFFTSLPANDLFTAVENATFQYWIRDTSGTTSFNGVNYGRLSSTSVSLQAATVTRNFGAGDVSGSVTQFVIVPEPASIALAMIGIGIAVVGLRQRRSSLEP
jgi:fibronectin-binding autotransporter adhesin